MVWSLVVAVLHRVMCHRYRGPVTGRKGKVYLGPERRRLVHVSVSVTTKLLLG